MDYCVEFKVGTIHKRRTYFEMQLQPISHKYFVRTQYTLCVMCMKHMVFQDARNIFCSWKETPPHMFFAWSLGPLAKLNDMISNTFYKLHFCVVEVYQYFLQVSLQAEKERAAVIRATDDGVLIWANQCTFHLVETRRLRVFRTTALWGFLAHFLHVSKPFRVKWFVSHSVTTSWPIEKWQV